MIPTIVILAVLGASGLATYLWLNQEAGGGVVVHNPEGTAGRALVVDHPGRGSFHPRVIAGFVEGLVAGGWRVEVTPANPQAPVELAGYDLLVLGSPTYWFAPSRPIRRTLRRAGDLAGKRTVTVVTGLGAGERSSSILGGWVRQANGDVVKALRFYRLRPNDDENYANTGQNMALAVEMARQAATEIPRPA